jgi:hypothetical protein
MPFPLSPDSSSGDSTGDGMVSIAVNDEHYDLAVTGDVFQWMLEYGDEETFQRVSLFFHKNCIMFLK